jgi:hypothetical protein
VSTRGAGRKSTWKEATPMSLNWDLAKIANHEELFVGEGDERRLDGLTHAFIWTSMVTGLGKDWTLDADFAPEFYARVKLLEKVNGPLVTKEGKEYPITFEDVRRRIGLHVNVSPVSRAEFIKSAVTVDLDRDARLYKADTEKVPA